jgi:cell division protein FtsQ
MARRPEAGDSSSQSQSRRASGKPSFFDRIVWGRVILWGALGMTVFVGTLFAWHRAEEFFIRDNRFQLSEPADFAGQSPSLKVEGLHYASPSQVRRVFAPDFGRSLYLVPANRRRQELLAIDWVEKASVSKVWPDTVRVRIEERRPVAFIHLPPNRKTGLSEFALIDKDGYILRPKMAARFTLPVIGGIRESEDREDRRARVQRVLSMLDALGHQADHISEVDVSDPNNLVVAEHLVDRVLSLMMGDENYSSRMSNFLSNYNEIRRKRPDSTTFDLRVDNLITVVGDSKHVQ